jgi:LEA14-like dessication related protein
MKRILGVAAAAFVLLGGCASLAQLLVVERPTASVDAIRITGLSFDGIELTADLTIDNPNPVGISLSELSYQLDIEQAPVLSGTTPDGLVIESFGQSQISVPLAVGFDEIRSVVEIASNQSELAYLFTTVLTFELPVIGEVAVPLQGEGMLPVIRLPRLTVSSLELDSIGLTQANLRLSLEVENPNAFPLGLEQLQYAFSVQDQLWLDGGTERSVSIGQFGAEEIDLVFSLSFLSFGRSVRDLLLGDNAIRYEFDGAITVDPGLPLLTSTTIPYQLRGSIPLSR